MERISNRERFLEAQYTYATHLSEIKNELAPHEGKILYIKNNEIKPLPKRKGPQKSLKNRKKKDRNQMYLANQAILKKINDQFDEFSEACSHIDMNWVDNFDLFDYSITFKDSLTAYQNVFGSNPAQSKKPVESNELISLIDSLCPEQKELKQATDTDESLSETTQNADLQEFSENNQEKIKEKFEEIQSKNPCTLTENPFAARTEMILEIAGKAYKNKDIIESGKTCIVYLYVSQDGHEVAVKVHKDPTTEYKAYYEACMHFLSQGQTFEDTEENKHIVKLLGTGIDNRGLVFTVMEYMPNGNVQNLRNKLTSQKIRDILGPTCIKAILRRIKRHNTKGAYAIKKQGITHFNQNLNNLMLDNKGIVKICGFGDAKYGKDRIHYTAYTKEYAYQGDVDNGFPWEEAHYNHIYALGKIAEEIDEAAGFNKGFIEMWYAKYSSALMYTIRHLRPAAEKILKGRRYRPYIYRNRFLDNEAMGAVICALAHYDIRNLESIKALQLAVDKYYFVIETNGGIDELDYESEGEIQSYQEDKE